MLNSTKQRIYWLLLATQPNGVQCAPKTVGFRSS